MVSSTVKLTDGNRFNWTDDRGRSQLIDSLAFSENRHLLGSAFLCIFAPLLPQFCHQSTRSPNVVSRKFGPRKHVRSQPNMFSPETVGIWSGKPTQPLWDSKRDPSASHLCRPRLPTHFFPIRSVARGRSTLTEGAFGRSCYPSSANLNNAGLISKQGDIHLLLPQAFWIFDSFSFCHFHKSAAFVLLVSF